MAGGQIGLNGSGEGMGSKTDADVFDPAQIQCAVLEGVKLANDRYKTWSDGDWLIDARTEGLMVSSIAETLFKLIDRDGGSLIQRRGRFRL